MKFTIFLVIAEKALTFCKNLITFFHSMSMFSLETFEKVCNSRREVYDDSSSDGISVLCPRCNSERDRKYGGVVEYKCGSSIAWGFLPSEYCYRKAFELNRTMIKELMAQNKNLRGEIDALKNRKNY